MLAPHYVFIIKNTNIFTFQSIDIHKFIVNLQMYRSFRFVLMESTDDLYLQLFAIAIVQKNMFLKLSNVK